jgi:23S rRNA pseudouridine2604 synthase
MEFPIRINKFLAEIGASTRRGADTLIENGKVFVNGKPAVIGQKIEANDTVEVRGEKKAYRYVLYYKPRGVITHSPAPDEIDIETQIKREHGITGLAPIGRLDKDSEGLILLTDDGRVTDRILNPKHAHIREYEVTVDKPITNGFLMQLKEGVDIEGYTTKRAFAEKVSNETFRLKLTEGKKHQVRRMCAALGYQVQKLVRISLLSLRQDDLTSGQYREINGAELKEFLSSLGL